MCKQKYGLFTIKMPVLLFKILSVNCPNAEINLMDVFFNRSRAKVKLE